MPWIISTNLPWTFHSLILPIYPSSWVDLVSCAKFLGLSSNSFSALGLQQFLFERHIPSAWVCHRFETESLFFVYSLFSHPTTFKHWNSVWVHLSNHQRLQRKYHENTIQAVSQSALNKLNILVAIIFNENRMLFFFFLFCSNKYVFIWTRINKWPKTREKNIWRIGSHWELEPLW